MKNSRGITLLLSVLIISIVLAVSLGVANIITTEIFLSNAGRQSQIAFYAADAGVECAAYWDTLHAGLSRSAFATSTPSPNTISCGGQNFSVGGWASCTPASCTTANDKKQGLSSFTLTFSNGSCAKVSVTKRNDFSDPFSPTIEAFIHSDGQNTCANTPRTFQRSIETRVFE
ncbi:MAG: pilus assembly PilX N-terminal domain-containing protein [Patescibacteria group bacterium]